MNNIKALVAEAIGTFWLVFAGLGSAAFSAGFLANIENSEGALGSYHIGIGLLGVAMAFTFLIITMAYAVGHISGGHFNPAVSLGLALGGRFPMSKLVPYIVAQVIGGLIGGLLLFVLDAPMDAISNGFGDGDFGSPGGYGLGAVFLVEVVLTAVFLFVIMGSTSAKAPAGFAPLAIGTCLGLIHLISIPVSNTSVNPARSIATAVFAGGDPLSQVWLFIVAPLLGGAIGGILYRWLNNEDAK